jgi:hypothetical protein
MLFGHWRFLEGNAFALKLAIMSRLALRDSISSVGSRRNAQPFIRRSSSKPNFAM